MNHKEKTSCGDTMHNKTFGSIGEEKACEYLSQLGYEIIDRNFETSCGELDIVALDGEMLVFAEVKTRKNKRYGRAALSVTKNKLRHIALSAGIYIKAKPEHKRRCCRIDVLEVYPGSDFFEGDKTEIVHLKNVHMEGVA